MTIGALAVILLRLKELVVEVHVERSRGQVIDLFTKKSKTCPSDL